MDEKNNGARRRKAFADFKENQYDDSFSLNPVQKRNITIKKIAKIALIVILTAAFIILGFCFTDSFMTASEQPYNDPNTYTPAFVNTTTTTTTTASGEDSSSASGDVSSSSQYSYQPYVNNQNQSAGNY